MHIQTSRKINMATQHPVRAFAWVIAMGLPLLTACEKRETLTPPVSWSSSEVGGSGLVLGAPGEQPAGLDGVPSTPGAIATTPPVGDNTSTALPDGRLDEKLPSPAAGSGALKPLNDSEQRFVRQALESSLYEVAVSALASDRAQSDATKRLAEQLLNDHRTANDKLQQLANGRMTAPSNIPADKQATIDQLSQAKGAAFDKQFLEVVGIQDQQKAIQLFESVQKDVQDAELKLFVQNTLPTLKHHLSTAQDLRSVSKATD